MSDSGDFWSKRKAAVAKEQDKENRAKLEKESENELAAFEGKSDDEILSALELPDPDTLGEGDDFSVFLSKAVPQRIQRRALRRLWLSNPALANLDELLEYGEDYTDAANVVENLQTAYQVGKGMLRHIEELAKHKEDLESEDEPPQEPEEEDLAAVEAEERPNETNSAPESPINVDVAEDSPLPVHRRMRFTFDND